MYSNIVYMFRKKKKQNPIRNFDERTFQKIT